MIAILSILLLQAATPAAGPALPADWSALPPLPYQEPPKVTPAMDTFVANEYGLGHCAKPKPGANGHYVVSLDIAALVASKGQVRRAVPRAIDCPTVEQYGAGLVTSFARDNLQPGANGDQWYRATLVFDWAP